MRLFIRALIGNLHAGHKLIMCRPTAAEEFAGTFGQVVVVAFMGLALVALSDYSVSQGTTWFNMYGLNSAVATSAVAVLVIALLAWSPPRFHLGRMLVALGVISCWFSLIWLPVILVVDKGILSADEPSWPAFAVAAILMLAMLVLMLVALRNAAAVLWHGSTRYWRRGVVLFGAVALTGALMPGEPIFYGDEFEYESANIWEMLAASDDETDEAGSLENDMAETVDVEGTYYAQPALLQARIEALLPERSGQSDLYFIGFGAAAYQSVFKREVEAVQQIFDENFGTAGRSLALINHRDTVAREPIASVSNLRAALARFGRMMNPEEDMLVLFLTSHGMPEVLEVRHGPLQLNDLGAAELKQMLDESGIKHRLIVVSACYAGSFIPVLRTAHSVVITAAAADRTSFGCTEDAEWTYFGDAYFNRSLREAGSFIDAFDRASELIEKWELEQELSQSDPRIFVGKLVRPDLFDRSVAPVRLTEKNLTDCLETVGSGVSPVDQTATPTAGTHCAGQH